MGVAKTRAPGDGGATTSTFLWHSSMWNGVQMFVSNNSRLREDVRDKREGQKMVNTEL